MSLFSGTLGQVLDHLRSQELATAEALRSEWRHDHPDDAPWPLEPRPPLCPMCGLDTTPTDDYMPECKPCGARWSGSLTDHDADGWFLDEDEREGTG